MQKIKKETKRSILPNVSRGVRKRFIFFNQWVKKTNKQKHIGIHLFAEFWFGRIIENPKKIKKILITAAKKSENTPLKTIIHKFSPQGITGVILLQESHIALHSWPEKNYLAIDIFTCGQKTLPDKAITYLKKTFKPKRVEIQKIKRGLLR
ncbi:MAG: adenosylmethionine decarboxylase [Candidatus Nealsonbacteria bacterium]|nr:adenosylmethionine decarboxylase [Candidatus Nealsonbacteria bacterium]